MAVRADAFRAVGGFDEAYLIGGHEDDDLCMKLPTAGSRCSWPTAPSSTMMRTRPSTPTRLTGYDWTSTTSDDSRRSGASDTCSLSVCSRVLYRQGRRADAEVLSGVGRDLADGDRGVTHWSDRSARSNIAGGSTGRRGLLDDLSASARNAALELAVATGCSRSMPTSGSSPIQPRCGRSWRTGVDLEAYLVAIENLQGMGNAASVHTAIRLFRRHPFAGSTGSTSRWLLPTTGRRMIDSVTEWVVDHRSW